MANSSTISVGNDILASQYNNLRLDVLDSSTGHDHNVSGNGKKVPPAGINPQGAASGLDADLLDGVQGAGYARYASGLYSALPAVGSGSPFYIATDVGLFIDDGTRWNLVEVFYSKVQRMRDDFDSLVSPTVDGPWDKTVTGSGTVAVLSGVSQNVVQLRNGGVGDYVIVAERTKSYELHSAGLPLFFEGRVVADTTSHYSILGIIGSMPAGATRPSECFSFEQNTAVNANWWALTRSNTGAETNATDTGVAVSATTYQRLTIIATATSSIKYYVDDVLKATHNPAVYPAGFASISAKSYSATATNRDFYLDYVDYWSKRRS